MVTPFKRLQVNQPQTVASRAMRLFAFAPTAATLLLSLHLNEVLGSPAAAPVIVTRKDHFFSATSFAVVGASEDTTRFGTMVGILISVILNF
jgi:hypothetical protein